MLRLLVLLGCLALGHALNLFFPTVGLCSPTEAPIYNCSFRRSELDPVAACGNLTRRFTVNTIGAVLYCSIFNADGVAYATDSYGLLTLRRVSREAVKAVLFYSLPKGVADSQEPTQGEPILLQLDPLLDLISLDTASTDLIRIMGRDEDTNRYSVISEVHGPGSDVLVTIDPVYFSYWQTAMRGFYRDLFLDPSTWLLCLAAVLVIWYAAIRSTPLVSHSSGARSGDSSLAVAPPEEPETIKLRMVLVLPLSGSLVLLAMFFFLDLMWPLLFVFCALAGFVSIAFVVWPVAELIPSRLHMPPMLTCLSPRIDDIPTATLFALPFSAAVLLAWWFTDLWLFTDLIALAIGIVSISHLRLPDLRVGAILLCVFFVYDIFWVFISPYFFKGESVMIAVAVNIRSLPMVIIVPHVFLDSPGLLGLGDVILPGLVLALLFRYDRKYSPLTSHWSGYFRTGMIGYVAGFVVTVLALVLSNGHGQPALLYLVPGVLIPTLIRAATLGEFTLLWNNGPLVDATLLISAEEAGQQEMSTIAHTDGQALLADDEGRTGHV